MKKSDILYVLALFMILLASSDINITGLAGIIFQVLWSVICIAIAYTLIKKSELFEKYENQKNKEDK